MDILFFSVTSVAVIKELTEGAMGILAGGRPRPMVVDTSSGDPAVTVEHGARLAGTALD